MDNWDEIRTAYQVAKMGTVSGAADILGVHHATVIRHIDALEGRLGVKLFQRHARGYTPTEAGEDLFRVAQTTDDQFSQLKGRIKGQGAGVGGELIVTSLVQLSPLIVPVLKGFQEEHPDVIVRFLTGERLFRLEYGEAHVAIRAGSPPEQPDNVVQPFFRQQVTLFAAKSYVEKHGMPKDEADYVNHRFVGQDDIDSRAPFYRWMRDNIPRNNVTFRSEDPRANEQAILDGAGIGFMAYWEWQQNPNVVKVCDPKDDWSSNIWIVTHVDLHRTPKVQTFLKYLKLQAKDWR
ncbi:LysR family transcriptional regulator [Donghicola tyrosinivorans]|uniref:DNA-binding transcriptional LysR family regulator n=1 Tax=Donghicola tyrosinivorans TaxID=1652492 RepID=A0A2T0WM51_9RHOB|nr:LysR family transcriptional regulator [Donghicola tyrosinivorans]PRY87776.1 DNA-binding transcriptional LysR family regulator [Donghicola tyrosinivorans]